MTFTSHTARALEAAVMLANSALKVDSLTTVVELERFYAEQRYTGELLRAEAHLEPVRAIRTRLRHLFLAEREKAVDEVNDILAEFHAVPHLTRHDDLDWHVHAIADSEPLADRILVETGTAMVDVIVNDEMSRFGVCAADDCEGLVLDLSRNRSRLYCSTSCANREATAAYRRRKRA